MLPPSSEHAAERASESRRHRPPGPDARRPRVVVVGSANTDLVVRVPRIPGPGVTVLGGALQTTAGGKGANQAVAAARAGGAVAFIGCVGDDTYGRAALAGLTAAGVDVRHVARLPGVPSGVALITVDDRGENAIAVAPGANAGLSREHVRRGAAVIADADVLVTQLEVPLDAVRAAVEIAAAHQTRVVLNPAPVAAQALDDVLLRGIAVLTPNAAEAAVLAGTPAGDAAAAAAVLRARGAASVVITLGGDGVLVTAADVCQHVAAVPVATVEDTTGAGDVFTGALAVARGVGASLLDATRFAGAAAALSVTRRGAQTAAPDRGAILDVLQQFP